VIELVLAHAKFAPTLGPQLLLLFPGREGLADRILTFMPKNKPRYVAERMKLGDPEAMGMYLSREGRRTALLDTMLGRRPATYDEASAEINRVGTSGYRAFMIEKGARLLDERAPLPGEENHLPYHALFHRMASLYGRDGNVAPILEKYLLRHFIDPHALTAVGAARRNVCQVLAGSGSALGLAGLVDLVARPFVRAVAVRGKPGKLQWVRVRDAQAFLMEAYHAERVLLDATDFPGTVGFGLEYNPVTRSLVYDIAKIDASRSAWREWWRENRSALAWIGGKGRFGNGETDPSLIEHWKEMDASFDAREGQERELRNE